MLKSISGTKGGVKITVEIVSDNEEDIFKWEKDFNDVMMFLKESLEYWEEKRK